jgi:hypothetical protein
MPKQLFAFTLALAIASILGSVRPAHAELPTVLQSGGAKLYLNGSGARTKYLMKLYVAGLYLVEPSKDAATIVAGNAPMAIRLEITSGMVTQEKLVESLNEGFDKSTKGKPESLRNEIAAFRACFAGEVKKGDVIDLVYLPARGVNVAQNGKQLGVIPGLAFKQALFGIWLSDDPADKNLKKSMLVAKAPSQTASK